MTMSSSSVPLALTAATATRFAAPESKPGHDHHVVIAPLLPIIASFAQGMARRPLAVLLGLLHHVQDPFRGVPKERLHVWMQGVEILSRDDAADVPHVGADAKAVHASRDAHPPG